LHFEVTRIVKDIKYAVRAQRAMRAMLIGLLPCAAEGVYLLGWRTLALVLFCCPAAYVVEVVFETCRGLGKKRIDASS